MSKNKLFNKKEKKEFILLLLSFFIGGITMILLIKFTPLSSKILGNTMIKNNTQVYDKSSLATSVSKIYDAVVVVQAMQDNNLSGTGTGFIYKVDNKYGYLLTNEHVLTESNKINIVMSTDEEIEAELLGKDEYLDLAILRIPKKYVSLVASIGKSEDMNLGDTIFTVGSPLGYDYRGSVTSGVLSGMDRMVTTSTSSSNNNDWVMRVLQIDASINPGNSGGPLLNANGEVIGICTMKLIDDDIEGMGFAIPIEYAMSHVDTLEKGKKIKWPVLGISMINVTDATNLRKNELSVPDEIKEGVVVLNIKKNSSAATSNLKKGDVITEIDGIKIKNTAYLKYELYKHQAGDTIEITYLRNGHQKKTKVKLGGSD